MSAWRCQRWGGMGNVFSGQQMNSVHEETLAVSDRKHNRPIVGNEHNRSLLLRRRRHKLTEESLRMALAPREKVLLEGMVRKCAKELFHRKLHKSVV